MRKKTLDSLLNFVSKIEEHYGKKVLTSKEVGAFRAANPLIETPACFWGICRTEKRGEFDLERATCINETAEENALNAIPAAIIETDEEIEARIDHRFEVMELMANAAFKGLCRSLLISGAAGVGKSFSILQVAESLPQETCSIVKGRCTSTGLIKKLWKHRFKDHVVVFDDCDSVFDSESTMNILKAACDSSDRRWISVENGVDLFDDNGDLIDKTFEFKGSIIFISNKNLSEEVDRGTRLAPHFEALISRSHYINLNIRTEREYMVRIKSVVRKTPILDEIESSVRDEILEFIDTNKTKMMELSLRIVKKVADLTQISPDNWKQMASVTLMRV